MQNMFKTSHTKNSRSKGFTTELDLANSLIPSKEP